jgi:hypothetical protein
MNQQLAEPLQVVRVVCAVLEKLDIHYFVCGSMASSLYGLPRSTQDIDLVADLSPHHVERLVAACTGDFYIDATMIRDAIQRESSFNIIHQDSMYKVDIFVLKDESWATTEMDRRREFQIGEAPQDRLWLASAEDTVLQKLRWYKLGGSTSEKQWSDIKGVLAVQQGNLDRTYLLQWARSLGVLDLLEKADRETAAA